MAYRVWILAGIVALALAAPAPAQPLIILPDHVTLGGSLARSDNADDNSGDHSPDVAATLELPLCSRYGCGSASAASRGGSVAALPTQRARGIRSA